MNITDPVSALPGVGEKRAQTLREIGIQNIGGLLEYFPRDYDDRSQVKTLSMLTPGVVNTLRGYIAREGENVTFARRSARGAAQNKPLVMTKLLLRDHTGVLELIWFNQPYLKKYFTKEQEYIFTGRVVLNNGRLQMESPDYEKIEGELLSGGRIVPIYSTVKSISQKVFRGLIHKALAACDLDFPDEMPAVLRGAYDLCSRKTAIQHIHFPEDDGLFLAARRRLVFEELFFMQTALFSMKGRTTDEPGIRLPDTDSAPFWAVLPFQPTGAQAKVAEVIASDLSGGGRMNRLVQGDVGSGKTAVAMAAAYLAIKNGGQAAIMAPTEVLAGQHFKQFTRFFEKLGIHTVLLTGSQPKKERTAAMDEVASGRAGMIVGTHALIQAAVEYKNLSLVITDEQHRFGVGQRLKLSEKGCRPHVLVMTATPIPRTLGLILFGDMDVSIIDELPPGRQAVKTFCVDSGYRARLHAFMRKEIEQGRQVYVICPAIEDADEAGEAGRSEGVQNVTRYTRELAEALPGIKLACLHGRMKPADKQTVMDDFAANRLQLIVATTVIEVGVDVPNASLMVVENADRFGLSQLHQLRGRVGRGAAQAYCVLVTDTKNEQTISRMKAMTQTTDGFRLSQLDMELRGTGDFFGTRQHGLPALKIANLYRDLDILKDAQTAAQDIFHRRTTLPPAEEENIKRRVKRLFDGANGVNAVL